MEPSKTNITLVALLWLAGLGAAMQFSKVSLQFTALQDIYPNAPMGVAFIVSLISFLGIILGLLAGIFLAKNGFRKWLIIALFLGGIISLYQATFPPLPLMLATRLLEGISHLIIVVAAPTMISYITAKRHIAVAMSVWSTFFGVTFALTSWFGLPLVNAYGPHALFLAHGIIMLAIGVLLMVALPAETPPETSEPINMRTLAHQHIAVFKSPNMAAPALGWLFYTLTYVAGLTLLPDFITLEQRGTITALMPLSGIVVSLTFGVWMLRTIEPHRVVSLGFALSAVLLVVFWIFPNQAWICIAIFAALGLVQSGSFAAVPALNETATDRALANGVMSQMGNLGNTIGTPILLIMITQLHFTGLILFALICYALGIFAHTALARRHVADGLHR